MSIANGIKEDLKRMNERGYHPTESELVKETITSTLEKFKEHMNNRAGKIVISDYDIFTFMNAPKPPTT